MARISRSEDLFKACFALFCLVALGIGGLAHFVDALMLLAIRVVILCLAGGGIFVVWRIRLAYGGVVLPLAIQKLRDTYAETRSWQ
jgi:hypothetical protein